MSNPQRYLQVKACVTVDEHARLMAEAKRRACSASELLRTVIADLPPADQPAFDSRAARLELASEGY